MDIEVDISASPTTSKIIQARRVRTCSQIYDCNSLPQPSVRSYDYTVSYIQPISTTCSDRHLQIALIVHFFPEDNALKRSRGLRPKPT